MTRRTIRDDKGRASFADQLAGMAYPFTVSITTVANRTAQQNATLHMWFGEVARHQTDLDANEVKGMCHRRWGLDIRMRCAKFAWVWEKSGARLPYEKQCAMLASGVLNVSSEMDTKELSEYMDAMSRHFRKDGVQLTDPEMRGIEEMQR